MDETLSLIIHGIELAKKLESNLPHLSEHPALVSKSCEELMGVFRTAVQQLNSPAIISVSSHSPGAVLQHESRLPPQQGADAVVQDWLSSSYTQAMDMLLRAQFSASSSGDLFGASACKQASAVLVPAAEDQINIIPPVSAAATPQDLRILEFGGILSQKAGYNSSSGVDHGEAGGSRSRTTSTAAGAEFQMIEGTTTDQSDGSPASKRTSRRRKDGVDKRTVRVSAPRIGNTEIPPEDGFTWRKYGQKEILGSMFPRGYFRCTHKNFYGCEAKKQVQRLDQDANIFEVTYYGHHTCHLSSSAPSAFPPTSSVQQSQPSSINPPPLIPHSSWPAAEANINITTVEMAEATASSTGESSRPAAFAADLQLPMYYYKDFIGSGSSSAAAAGGPAGPSSQRGERSSSEQAKEGDLPVMDLADAMFNSGSSSNSMDSIFPSMGREN
ncbi:hypothetical protein Scep_005916 [Stephania cephalantha]|uniref:WRKY domain-containing protein n=1 Tax=Stephania cephalantha TaxID=152367 RepID=A0AAP0KVA0_9MAGN